MTIVNLVLALPIRLFDITETLAPGYFGGVSAPFGITAHFFAVYITTGEILLGFLIWFTVGVLVFWRKSDEVSVTYFSAILVAASVFLSDFAMSFAVQRPAWSTLIYLMRASLTPASWFSTISSPMDVLYPASPACW